VTYWYVSECVCGCECVCIWIMNWRSYWRSLYVDTHSWQKESARMVFFFIFVTEGEYLNGNQLN